MKTGAVVFRLAKRDDLPAIVRMLADDDLGSQRERYEEPIPESYTAAFEQIEHDANHELIVAELNGVVIGTLHLMFCRPSAFKVDCVRRLNQCAWINCIRDRGLAAI